MHGNGQTTTYYIHIYGMHACVYKTRNKAEGERKKNEFVNSSGMLEISVSDTHSAVRLLDLRSVRMDIVCVSHSRSNIDRDGRKENS